jgi:hypothetical protein
VVVTAVMLNPMAALNTGNGDTGPTWAVALFVVAWVLIASLVIFLKVKNRK